MRLKIVSIVCMVLLAAPVQAGWDEGWDAYKRRDYAAAVNEFMTLAEQGDVQAQVTLTIMFVFDEGARKFMNMKKVEKWFGVVRRQNFDKTLIWFRNAANRGDTKAWTILGHLYSGDFGAPRKNDESTKWWLKAAVHGEVTAQKTLSHLFAYRSKNVESEFWSRKAAEQGDGLVHAHHAGKYSQSGDEVHAYMWLDLAMAQGSTIAKEGRDALAAKLSPDQVAEAKKLVIDWWKDHKREPAKN